VYPFKKNFAQSESELVSGIPSEKIKMPIKLRIINNGTNQKVPDKRSQKIRMRMLLGDVSFCWSTRMDPTQFCFAKEVLGDLKGQFILSDGS
jgi:hypothetical protein